MAENVARDGVPLADGTVHDRPIDVPRRLVPGTGSSTWPESGEALLRACVDEAAAAGASRVSLCFADRLPGVEQTSAADAAATLARARLELDEASWLPNPGSRGHMGASRGGRGSAVFLT